jgi:hypothetical protein
MIACICSCFLLGCQQGEERVSRTGDIELHQYNDRTISDRVRLRRAVPLETTDLSILGTVYKVKLSPANNDILVGDFRSQKKILRFSPEGAFSRRYGTTGDGPGEYQHIVDFEVLPDNTVVILSFSKLIHYAVDGTLLGEIDLDYRPEEIVVSDEAIIIKVGKAKSSGAGLLAIYNHDATFRGYEGKSDPKLEKYWLSSRNGMAGRKGEIALSDRFSFSMSRLIFQDGKWVHHGFPDHTPDFEEIWRKDRLTREDENRIRRGTHRLSSLFALDQGYFFLELSLDQEIHRYNLFTPETLTLYQLQNEWVGGKPPGPWSYLVGSSRDRLIALLDDEEIMMSLREKEPLLSELEVAPDDNPVLLFYEVLPFDGQ